MWMTFDLFKTVANYLIDNMYFDFMLLEDVYKYQDVMHSEKTTDFLNDIALQLQIEYQKNVYVVSNSEVTHFNAECKIQKPTDLFILPKKDIFVIVDSYEPEYFSKSSDDNLIESLKYYKIPTLGFCYKQTICFY
jgi:hypothetical protein